MKEKPSRTELPSTRKCLPAGVLVMRRLTFVVPAAWVTRGSSSHSSSSTNALGYSGLGHQKDTMRSGTPEGWLHACHNHGTYLPKHSSYTYGFL